MSQLTRIAEVEDALVGRLKEKLADVNSVSALTNQDFASGDELVTDTPAIRVVFAGERLDRGRDHIALTYQSVLEFTVLCGATNLRSYLDERTDAAALVSRVEDALAGYRPELPSHTQAPQVVLLGAALVASGQRGTWYGVRVAVHSVVQFSGQ